VPNPSRLTLAACAAAAALVAPASSLAREGSARHAAERSASHVPALLRSRELWATIDVCNTAKQPDTIGIRGSMPGDGHAHDEMYMSFHLQYLNAVNQWVELPGAGGSGYSLVGSAASARQAGSSFTLKPRAGKPPFTLRGVVGFRWMRANTIMQRASRPTSSGHDAVVGAEPKGYSAATCSAG